MPTLPEVALYTIAWETMMLLRRIVGPLASLATRYIPSLRSGHFSSVPLAMSLMAPLCAMTSNGDGMAPMAGKLGE